LVCLRVAQIDAPAGGHQRRRIERAVELQICCPRQHHFIERPFGDSLCGAGDQRYPRGFFRDIRFAQRALRDRHNGLPGVKRK
jgi:hypothetical protein